MRRLDPRTRHQPRSRSGHPSGRRVGKLGPDDPRQIPGFAYVGPSPRPAREADSLTTETAKQAAGTSSRSDRFSVDSDTGTEPQCVVTLSEHLAAVATLLRYPPEREPGCRPDPWRSSSDSELQ
jgi:hypothetical protein